MKLPFWILPCTLALAAAMPAHAGVFDAGLFSHATVGALPPGWMPLTFPNIHRHTHYALVSDGGRLVVRAQSQASASGLVAPVRIDPHAYPIVRWRWKIANLIPRADLHRKAGDDYPARLYVSFRGKRGELSFLDKVQIAVYRKLYGRDPPTAAINYVWDGKAPAGTVAPNAYTNRVRMIVVRSGARGVGRWVQEQRNLLADYRAAFGRDAPPVVSVAIMTDTDNTGAAARAWYGDVQFLKAGAK